MLYLERRLLTAKGEEQFHESEDTMERINDPVPFNDPLPRAALSAPDVPYLTTLLQSFDDEPATNLVVRQLAVAIRFTIHALQPHLPLNERRLHLSVARNILDRLELMPAHVWKHCAARDQFLLIATLNTYLPILPSGV